MTTTPARPEPLARTADDHRWMVLVVVSIAQLIVVLDSTIVNIALPSAQLDLGFADSQRQWIVTAYALAFGSLLLIGGRISDMFGRKLVFLAGMALFAAASIVGGAADSFGLLVAARVVQGAAGALIAPAALSTLITTFHEPADRAKAFGVFGSVAVGGGGIGLILGGVLTEYLSWRWTMYVNVVFAVVAAVGAFKYMVRERGAVRERLDVLGTAVISAGLFLLVYGFAHAETHSWTDAVTIGALVLGVVLIALFVRVEQRASTPLLPLRVVTDRTRAAAFYVVWVAGVAMFSVFLFLTFYLQLVKGMSPIACGLAFLPLFGAIAVSSNLASIVAVPRWGARVVIAVGLVIAGAGLGWMGTLGTDTAYAVGVLPGLLLLGLGIGMVVPPAMNTATLGVEPQDAGVASALTSTVQQVGGSMGTAVLSTIVASVAGGTTAADMTDGYVVAFVIAAALFGVSAVLAVWLIPSPTRSATVRQP
jgi:EmrB/QacA subfamily drug resistance transporter